MTETPDRSSWTALFGTAPDLPVAEEPTFTASEVKELTTKATEVALALGRKEALREAEVGLVALSRWIDGSPGYATVSAEAVDWRRITKLVEEAGEVVGAYAGSLGENPRKGRTHSLADVRHELYDVAVSALGAIAHLRGNDPDAETVSDLLAHIRALVGRAGLASQPRQAVSNGLTAPTGHSDLPPTPEAVAEACPEYYPVAITRMMCIKPTGHEDQHVTREGVTWRNRSTPDLPDGRDQ